MAAGVLGFKDNQEEIQKGVESMAKGETPGITSGRFTMSDMAGMQNSLQQVAKNPQAVCYVLAGMRDAPYSAAGRCYLRRTALNMKHRIAYMRALASVYMGVE